jgi:hypothetical protein
MKHLLLLPLITFFTLSLYAQEKKEVIKLSEPVQVTESYEMYGAKIKEPSKTKSLSDGIESLNDANSQEVVLKTSIAEVCEKKGCFFIAQDNKSTARVTFKDYSFFIPTDSQGKEVIIVGTLSKKTLTEEKAKHYAEDAGKNADEINGEQVEYSIEASSIIIQKGI